MYHPWWAISQEQAIDRHAPLSYGDPMSSELFTATKVGSKIGKSARTVSRLAQAGKIPFTTKLEGDLGAYLFSQADIDAYLAAEAVQS